MPGSRHKARIAVMQALYEADCTGHDARLALEHLLGEGRLTGELAAFASELLEGVLAHKESIDSTISRYAPARPLQQMAPVDRNILRLALYEVLVDGRVPLKAAINEAVELAKAFGSESSPKFVNGVLGSVSAPAVK